MNIDPPVLTTGATVSFTEQGSAVVLDAGLTLSDADSATLANATVSIAGGFLSGDTLTADTTGTAITASYNAATGVMTLSGLDTLADYQAVLRSTTFSSASDNPTNFGANPSRSIGWTVNDGIQGSAPTTSTVNVTAVNDAPVLTAGVTVGFTEQGSAVVLASGLTLSDSDNTTLASATVSITSGLFAGDVLNFTNQNGISASYDGSTGVLTLTGSASVANYQAALRSITFSSVSDNPTNFGASASRTVTWTASDGALNSAAATSTVNVTAVNDAPVLTAGATVGYTEQGAAVVLDAGLTLSDADNATLASATVSIGRLRRRRHAAELHQQPEWHRRQATTAAPACSPSSAAPRSPTTSAALQSITFSSASDNPTNFGSNASRTISWTANDGTVDSTAATSTVTVTAVNDAPVVTAGATVGFTEQGTAVVLDSGLVLSDADNTTLAGATVSIGSGLFAGDTLSFVNQNGITGSYDGSTGVLTLTGSASVANYQAALQSITFSSASDNPTNFGDNPSRTINWTANDGALNSAAATSTVNITAVNDAPVLAAGATVGFTEQVSAVVLDSGLTLSDPDNTTLAGATVSIGSLVTGDTLNFVNQNGITGSYNSGTGVLTLTGTDTVANYQAALRSITFSSASDNPTNFGASASRTISWTANDGTANSAAATSTVNVTAVNDAPVLTAGATVGFTEQGTAAVLDSGLTLGDADNTTLASATVSIGSFVAGDTLNFTNQNGITGSYDSGTGVLSLTGSSSVANYQAALRSITFSSASDNPTNFGANASRTISWTASDGALSSTAATSTLNVTAVDDAPTVTAGATVGFTEQGSAVVLDSGLTLSDADNTTLASATVSIGGFVAGDVLNFSNQHGITGSYDSGTGVLTLTGSASVANYQTALRSITFSSASDNPTNFGANASRTISWTANDGTNQGNATSTLGATAVNDAPVIAGTSGVTDIFIQPGAAVTLEAAVTASDADSATLASTAVSITSGLLAGDTLAADTTGTAITASYNAATGVLTLSGTDTIAHYNQVLQHVTFASSAADPTNGGADTARTISWKVDDGSSANNLSNTATTSLDIHVRPVVMAGDSVVFNAGGGPVLIDPTVTASDADLNPVISAHVAITTGRVTGDTLAFNGGTDSKTFIDGSTIIGSYNSTTGVLTLTVGGGAPTTADFQQALRSATFDNAGATPGSAAATTMRTLSWTLDTANPNQTSIASTSMVGPAPTPPPPPSDTAPTVGAPPVPPPPPAPITPLSSLLFAAPPPTPSSSRSSTGFTSINIIAKLLSMASVLNEFDRTINLNGINQSRTSSWHQGITLAEAADCSKSPTAQPAS